MDKVIVVANGIIEDRAWLKSYLAGSKAVIIAANGGGKHLSAVNFRPDFLIGDLDSLPEYLRLEWERTGTVKVTYPAEKDETDLELALLFAAAQYQGDIEILGALGGRLDQTLANIYLLAHPAFERRRLTLVEPAQQAWLIREKSAINGRIGDRVSLLSIGGDVKVRRTAGLKWPLKDEILEFGPARGISNVMVAETAVIEIARGLLLCVHLKNKI